MGATAVGEVCGRRAVRVRVIACVLLAHTSVRVMRLQSYAVMSASMTGRRSCGLETGTRVPARVPTRADMHTRTRPRPLAA
jgi:hypothetical protein